MGELILCSHPIAAMPYYIDNISLNVYSLEELCYYIENHLYLIEADFMSEELCLWIGQELDEKDLAQSLRSVLLGNGSLSDFTELILRSCGYCSEDTIRHIRSVLLDMQNKSVFECSKIRADRYMESEKYVKAIHEYRKLLGMEEECKKNPVLEGNIRHNLCCWQPSYRKDCAKPSWKQWTKYALYPSFAHRYKSSGGCASF